VRQVLRGGSTEFGLLLSGLGVGYLVGAPVARRLLQRMRPGRALAGGLTALGACFFVAFHGHQFWVAAVAIGLAGVPGVLILVTVQTEYQRATLDQFLGRIGAAFVTVEMVASVSGAAVTSVAASQIELTWILNAVAGGLVILALATWLLFGSGRVPPSEAGI
jgi:predicted MFS family arabinose efflux permease